MDTQGNQEHEVGLGPLHWQAGGVEEGRGWCHSWGMFRAEVSEEGGN